jgi:hypothetical protein
MTRLILIKTYIEDIFKTSRFAVLATEGGGQPHARLQSADCALICIKVDRYQVVRGIDDVEWWTVDELN